MTAHTILTGDDPHLHEVARRVRTVDDSVRTLVEDLIETMKAHNGIGIAATQVGVTLRVFVVGTGETPFALINPAMAAYTGEDLDVEGCLSLPGVLATVKRYQKVRFRGLDPGGKKVTVNAEALTARVLQHELDHLDGILITDRAEPGTIRHVEKEEAEKSKVPLD